MFKFHVEYPFTIISLSKSFTVHKSTLDGELKKKYLIKVEINISITHIYTLHIETPKTYKIKKVKHN